MNILSDLVWFEGGKDSEKKSLDWLNRCLEINPDDLFAKTRKKYIEERQTVQEQIRRFKHDTGNTKAGIEAMLTLCLSLPQAKEEPLRTYLKTVQTEVKHLYGVHRFVHNEQCRIEETDPQEVISDLTAPHDRRNANFTITVSGTLKKWNTDPDYLRLALYNLIQNALEAFQRRRIPLKERDIRISLIADSQTLVIEDNAGGIDPALKDHIFSPYVSSKGIKKGVGLGLPNARRAFEIMGGTLDLAEKQPKNGARFEIRLPE
jgi:signal transduction histidine kinase